jgi:hypothetical protein
VSGVGWPCRAARHGASTTTTITSGSHTDPCWAGTTT